MIEFIAAAYVGGLIASALVAFWNVSLTRQKLNSNNLRVLNHNLAKVGLFWMNAHDDFAPRDDGAVARDRGKTLRNAALVGLLGFGGAIGFVLLVIVVISMNFIARSRKQIAVFQSDLATRESLSPEDVDGLVKRFQYI